MVVLHQFGMTMTVSDVAGIRERQYMTAFSICVFDWFMYQ